MDKLSLLITEKETILKEVHHRIKNNMNIILSLLRLQIEQYKENKEIENILNDASSRIKSMMILYDTLYLSKKKTEISTKDYLSSLIDGIVEIFPKKIELTVKKEIQDFMLNEKILSIIGIILNELITNSIKHAFCGRKKGTITFILSKSNGNIVMIFKDDGIGMPAEFNIENSPGFGSKLISLLISQINGVLSINSSNGIEYNIRFSI